MSAVSRQIDALRGLHRSYKLAWVLLAAWAPFVLAQSPWLAIAVMGGCTALFFLSTRRRGPMTTPAPADSALKDSDHAQS